MTPQFSIIIPTFNRESFIVKALESVLNQSFTDYEIIVVDDGSTDNTQTVLRTYAGRITCVYQQNSGVSSARNHGIRRASGDWIAFLDSDDEWMPDYLSNQAEQISRFPESIGHVTNAVTFQQDGQTSNYFDERKLLAKFGSRSHLNLPRPLRTILNYELFLTPATVLRRDVVMMAGVFDTSLSIAEDLDLIARVGVKGPFTLHNKPLLKIYRRNERTMHLSGLGAQNAFSKYSSFGRVYSRLLGMDGITSAEKVMLARHLSSNWRALGNALVIAGRALEARKYYKRAFLQYPSAKSLLRFGLAFLPGTISYRFGRKAPLALAQDYPDGTPVDDISVSNEEN